MSRRFRVRPMPELDPAGGLQRSAGLAIGLSHPGDAERLLSLIEAEDAARLELHEDAAAFCEEARRGRPRGA